MKSKWLFLLGCVLSIHLMAKVEVKSRFLTTADGLSNNSVRYLYQDSKGFVWMGTMNGLNRYDGNSFLTFQSVIGDTLSLADNRVWSILEDKQGFLWIGTSANLFSCYDSKHDCFVDFTGCGEYRDQYRYITITDKNVWLYGDNGCRRICYIDGEFSSQAYGGKYDSQLFEKVRLIKQGTDDVVWICTDKGLFAWKEGGFETIDKSRQYQWVTSLGNEDYFMATNGDILKYDINKGLLSLTNIPHVHSGYDLPGEITLKDTWLLFTSTGGYLFNPQTNSFTRAAKELDVSNGKVTLDNKGNPWVSNGTGVLRRVNKQTGEVMELELMDANRLGFIDMERYHIVSDERGIIWISTYGNGLFAYDTQTKVMQHFDAENDKLPLIASNTLMYLMEDRSGSLWVSAEYAGVAHLNVANEGAACLTLGGNKAPVRLIKETDEGNIYIGTRDGRLFLYNSDLTVLKKSFTFKSNVYAIAKDDSGVEWMGTRVDGLYVGGKRYKHDNANPSSLSHNQVFCLLKDRGGRMWIGTLGGGLDLAVPDGKGGYYFKHFLTESYAISRVRTMYEDHNGWIWVGTSEGLVVFNPEELLMDNQMYYQYSFTNQALGSNEIRSITQDSKGNVYIAETGAGFSVCTPPEDYNELEFKRYGVEHGLVNNMVQAFVEDNRGLIWISTEYGVSCFHPQEESFENFFFFSNVLGNVYSEDSAWKLQDGRIVMGTNEGLFIADPSKLHKEHHDLLVTFTDLKVGGISIRDDKKKEPEYVSLSYTSSVKLSYAQNSFEVDFSTLDYATSAPKYSFLLEGYDKQWSIPSTMNFAMYKNLSSGTYRLRVKACDETGLWGSEESVLTIIILPPFWLTGWAFLIYGFLVLLAVYVTYRILAKMNTLRNNVKIEKQLTDYKLMFFTNISHEFRTPLTLIQAALEKISSFDKMPKELTRSVHIMEKSTQRMLRLINQLLEFRKMQNDKLSLALEKMDVMAELQDIANNFTDVIESKHMNFTFVPSMQSYLMYVDRGYLDKIMYNLLSNSFKYTPSG